MSSSSWLLPLRIGTRAKRPAASAVPIDSVRTLPSTTPGMAAVGKLFTRSSTGTPRRHSGGLVGTADAGREGLTERLGVGQRQLGQRERAALHDRPLEQPPGVAGDEVREHGQAAGRLTGDGDVARVAAELVDVALHPPQRGLLVHQPVVAGRAAGSRRQRGMGQEPERAEPVVDGDDHGAFGGQLRRVVVAGAVRRQAAAVDPHEHRTAATATIARSRACTR